MLRSAALVGIALATLLSGCAAPLKRLDLAETIGEDSAAFASAYGRSANNQALLNVLQARDGLPRHYVTVSGITDTPSTTASGTLGLNPLGLGNPVNPFGQSNFSGTVSADTKPTYKIEPTAPDRLVRWVYSPISPDAFRHFWENGVPRDVLFHLFIREIEIGECVGLAAEQVIQEGKVTLGKEGAGELVAESATSAQGPPCRFKRWQPSGAAGPALLEQAIRLVTETEGRDVVAIAGAPAANVDRAPPSQRVVLLPVHAPSCELTASAKGEAQRIELLKMAVEKAGFSYSERPGRDGPVGELRRCPATPRLALVLNRPSPSILLFNLRSLDQVMAFLGEETRGPGPAEDRPPLLVIHTDDTSPGWTDDDFAAVLDYRGDQVRAGPAKLGRCDLSDRLCSERSALVLSLLVQLLTLVPAESTLRPPDRLVLD